MRTEDLTGKVFERLTVIKHAGKLDGNTQHAWECKCSCGTIKIIRGHHLRSGFVKSCGCLKNEKLLERSTKHGHSPSTGQSSEYMTWSQIVQRCTNPDHPRYRDYGGRGITVCDRWLKFENFIQDVGLRPSPIHTLDRRDNNLGYNPNNYRWITNEEQASNKRTNVWITWEGQRMTLTQWSRYWKIPYLQFRSLLVKHGVINAGKNTVYSQFQK